MSTRPTIVHVISGLTTGGAETMLLRLVRQLAGEWQARVVSLTGLGSIGARLQDCGVPVTSLAINGPVSGAFALYRLQRMLRQQQPCVVQGWMYHGNVAATLGAAGTGIPVVWSIRASLDHVGFEKRSTRMLVRLGAALSGQPFAVTYNAVAAAAGHEAIGYRAAKTTVIPNGFDLTEYQPDGAKRSSWRLRNGLPLDCVVIGMVARFDPYKDHHNFIRAAAQVARIHPSIRFVLAGRQIDRDNRSLVGWLAESGLSEQTLLLGETETIPDLMTGIDILCSASVLEAFPNVVGEAMACATPCVVTDVGDSALLVGEAGVVVPPANDKELADGLLRVVGMGRAERIALGEQARNRIAARFALRDVGRQFAQLYHAAQRPRRNES